MYFVVELLASERAASDRPTRAYEDRDEAFALKDAMDEQDRQNGTYRVGRWRVVEVK